MAMFVSKILGVAFMTCASASAINGGTPTAGSILPGAYIVQFEPGHNSTDSFYQNLTNNGIEAAHRQTFGLRPEIFSGTSFHLASYSKEDLDLIGNFTQVKSISPVRLFQRVAPISKPWKGVDWTKIGKKKVSKRVITSGNGTFSTLEMTGVDKLHREGLDGSGIVIAEIDTGIDYTHPALGGCFGPGCKVAFGTDLVGDAYTGDNTPVPDDDPIDCAGHGTHVAGIIAASNDPYVLGVAPNATLGIYKVFGCEGSAANDVLISAFIMAYNYGVDVITSSIGGASGWPEEPWSAVAAAIIAAGTPCMLANGNDGAEGLYYASTASAGTEVTSVGSVDNSHSPETLFQANYTANGLPNSFGYALATGSFAGLSLPLWTDSTDPNVANDGCNDFTADLTGKIVLIRRSGCTFVTKAQSAIDAGASYVLFYNNFPGTIIASLDGSTIAAAGMVDPSTGANFVSLLAVGDEVVLTFPTDVELLIVSPGDVNTPTGGKMSTFSTWNPSNENSIKPVVCAPGGNILSTYLASQGSYAVLSGTSMATPFIAGVVALYKQAKGKGTTPLIINAALSSTAKPVKFNDGTNTSPFLTSIAQQGGGLVDAYHMIYAGIAVTETNIALNDTRHHVSNAAFDVQNLGTATQTYTLTHQPAANAYAFDLTNTDLVAAFPPPLDTKYSSVTIFPPILSLEHGQKKRVTIVVLPNPSLNTSLVPVYSGYINITSSLTTESISIPYLGVATVMNNITILASDASWPDFNDSLAVSTNDSTSTFKPSSQSFPVLYWNTRWAMAEVRLDVLSTNPFLNKIRAAGLSTYGSVSGYPLRWQPRGVAGQVTGAEWNGTLADGRKAVSGNYKFVLRFAKGFGDLNRGREFESYESEAFAMDMS